MDTFYFTHVQQDDIAHVPDITLSCALDNAMRVMGQPNWVIQDRAGNIVVSADANGSVTFHGNGPYTP